MAGVEKANKCRTIIQDYVSKIPSYVDKSLAIKTAEQEIENISAEIDKIKKDLKEYVDIDKEYTNKSRELDNLKLKITEEDKTLKISELSNKIKGIESGISELTGGVGEIEEVDAPADSDHAIVNWYKVYSDKYNQNKSELKKLGETIEEVEDNPEELYEELTTLKNKHVELKDKISLIKQGKCPTCTRPFDNAEQEVDSINNQITEIKVAFENKKIEYTELKNKAEEITKTNSRRTILLNEIKTAENSRPEELDSTSYDEAVARIESYRKYSDKIKEAQKVEKEKLKLVEEKSSLVERLNQVKNLETVSEDSISKVEAELQNLKEKKDEFDSKSKTLISLETQVSEKHKQVAEYKEDQKKGNANREIINFLDKAKTVLHRDNLPMLVLEDRRRTLNAVMNKMMKYVDAGYSPRLTKEFDFVIDFRNGPSDRPIKDLSGGQLVLLSSLFHLVKLELLGSIPFLVLDEPTMYLNTSDLSDMASMFKSYLENKGKEGTYIMIPTHEDELKPCFTNIFTFSEHAV